MVAFIGAGPGDPELITVKGLRLLQQADVVVYAGSLINHALLKETKAECALYNSALMALDEIMSVMICEEKKGKAVVRLHSGDPSIYGAIREQMDILKKNQITYQVVPGVSSFLGAAAALQVEYTLPGVSQTVILTRANGRTAVPEKESLKSLAEHRSTMAIFLSIDKIDTVIDELTGAYRMDTPTAVVYKATWPQEEIIIRGTLENIAQKTKEAGIYKTALIIVGGCLGEDYELSKLYDKTFETGYRKASL